MSGRERGRTLRKLALRVSLALLLGACAFEGSVRFLLFADAAADWRLARELRRPWRFASSREPLYWYLQDRFLPPGARGETPVYDSDVGWLGTSVTPERRHVAEDRVGDRRIVLLFGNSYAQCTTEREDCFEGLLEDSPLGREVALLNFGVGGYGLDQIALLAEQAIARYADLDPVVVVSIMLNDDLDRCLLDFRCWPKPRLRLVGGELVSDGPVAPSIEEHWRRRPPAIGSWAWRLVERAWRGGAASAPAEEAARRRECEPLVDALLRRLDARLVAAKARRFYLLFEYRDTLGDPELLGWRKRCVLATLDALGAPWIETRTHLLADAERERLPVEAYFGRAGRNLGHFNVLGNQTAFRSLLDGLRRFGGIDAGPENEAWLARVRGRAHPRAEHAEAARGVVRYELAAPGEHAQRLTILCDGEGRAELAWTLAGRSRELRARAELLGDRGAAELRWSADGEELAAAMLGADARAAEVVLDVSGRDGLRLDVRSVPHAELRLVAPTLD